MAFAFLCSVFDLFLLGLYVLWGFWNGHVYAFLCFFMFLVCVNLYIFVYAL